WFGGSVNGKYFVSFSTWDDCFDVDYGYSGNIQFGLSIRRPSFADQSGSNAFECDNGPNDNDVLPYTTGTFSNITAIGPIAPGFTSINANYQHAIDLRRRTAVSITNSVFIGWPRGLRMNQPSVVGQYQAERGILYNNVLVTPSGANQFVTATGVALADITKIWEDGGNTTISGNPTNENVAALGLKNLYFVGAKSNTDFGSNPDFKIIAGTLNTASKFDKPKFQEANRMGFFQAVPYVGAFGQTADWTDGWAEFNPVAKAY
ncbi:MAG TPA: hypothetical protein PKD85_07970, partial [Saprospiraceae bacterium]|nr:hypothetical protein [Saprospiraceae bacterium]